MISTTYVKDNPSDMEVNQDIDSNAEDEEHASDELEELEESPSGRRVSFHASGNFTGRLRT